MSRYNLRYQISLFADFSTLSPSEEIYSQLESAYTDSNLMRVPFTENTISEAGTVTRDCIKVTSSDNAISIEFRSDRVIFTWLNTDINQSADKSIGVFTDNILDVMQRVDILKDTLYRRIGYVRYSLFDSPTPDDVYSYMNKTIPFLQSAQKREWVNYMPSRYTDGRGEEYNIVTTIKHTNGPLKKDGVVQLFDGVFLSIDVNTLDEQRIGVYNYENVKNKLSTLRDIERRVSSQYLDLLNGISHAE